MANSGQEMRAVSSGASQLSKAAAWPAMSLTIITILLLASLHLLSPEFAPSWRMISEYAFGRYGWVLSLMFLCWALSTWACVIALWPLIQTRAGKAGLYFLILAGFGEAMASVFDIRHPMGHGVAGLFGVIGFPIAALLVSVALRRSEEWREERSQLLRIANLSWIAVLFLIATLVIMTMQVAAANGGHLPQHAPKSLPPGVLALDGWADRLIVLVNCAWVFLAARRARQIPSSYSPGPGYSNSTPRVSGNSSAVMVARANAIALAPKAQDKP